MGEEDFTRSCPVAMEEGEGTRQRTHELPPQSTTGSESRDTTRSHGSDKDTSIKDGEEERDHEEEEE